MHISLSPCTSRAAAEPVCPFLCESVVQQVHVCGKARYLFLDDSNMTDWCASEKCKLDFFFTKILKLV